VVPAIENTRALPLRDGLAIPAAVLIVEVGPVPPVPAQELQLCQPDILWIAVFTVWAVAVVAAKDARRKPVSAAMEIEKHFTGNLIVICLLHGVCYRSVNPSTKRRYIDGSTLDQSL
jgi:hypothetical protein